MDLSKVPTSYDVWKNIITELFNIMKNTQQEQKRYAVEAMKQKHFQNVIKKQMMDKLCNKKKITFPMDGQNYKNIIRDKYKAINQEFFENISKDKSEKLKNKKLKFRHKRLDKIFNMLKNNSNRVARFSLSKNQILQILSKNQKKNLSVEYICLMGFMLVPQKKNTKQTDAIEIDQLVDNSIGVQLQFEPMFDKAEIQSYLNTKGFEAASCQKFVNNVRKFGKYTIAQGMPALKDMKDKNKQMQPFFEGLQIKNEFSNVTIAFNILGGCLNIEYVSKLVKQKTVKQYTQKFVILEGVAIARGIICGMLSHLKRKDETRNIEEQLDDNQEDVYTKFVQFFGGIFVQECEEQQEAKQICKGIWKIRQKTNKEVAQIIQQQWVK